VPGGDDDPLLSNAGLLAAWQSFRDARRPFTIPGHKGRAGRVSPALGALLHSDVPLYGGLDTVKQDGGLLGRAQAAAAAAWGGDWAFFSTGGSTHGNQAMALAVGRPGDTVLVARNAHRSTLLGLVYAGLRPVWLPVAADRRFGIPTGIELQTLRAALNENPTAAAVFLTEPAYLGVTSDLPRLIELAHDRHIPVIVDQAWGAHFGFHPAYPAHALAHGADALVLSAHKTLPAYSQASLLVALTDRLAADRLDRAAEAGQSTSPAGSILAGIDASRALLDSDLGRDLLGGLVEIVGVAREQLRALPGVAVPGPDDFPPGRFDPAKLVVQVAGAGVDGNQLEQRLIEAGLPVEMADRDTLVPIITLIDSAEDVAELVDTLVAAIGAAARGAPRPLAAHTWPPGRQRLTPREAFFADRESVPWDEAAGRICAEVVAPYPPGVPVLVPGEEIDAETLLRLRELAEQGTRVAYAADPSLGTLQVLTRAPDGDEGQSR
jgi:lysine decarboxylase